MITIWAVLAFALMLALIMGGGIRAVNWAVAHLIGDRHRALEHITRTGDIPPAWRARYERQLARLDAEPAANARRAQLEKAAATDYVRRLDALVRYAETTNLVADEETREILLTHLGDAREKWRRVAGLAANGQGNGS